MKLQRQHIVLLTLILVGSLSLFAWWSAQVQQLKATTWKTLPPELTPLPQLAPLQPESGNQSLERPLFWESRRPLAPQAAATTAATVPLELLGIISEGNLHIALLRPLQGTPPLRAQRLRVGDNYNGITLQDINHDQVTLKGANGIEVLRIQRGSQNPAFSQQPAKLIAPANTEVTRTPPHAPQKITNDPKDKARSQPPVPQQP